MNKLTKMLRLVPLSCKYVQISECVLEKCACAEISAGKAAYEQKLLQILQQKICTHTKHVLYLIEKVKKKQWYIF
jgi:hypothetical protein